MNQLVPLLKNTSPRAKIGLGVGALVTLIVFFMLFKMATAPSYVTLMSGVEPSQTSKITAALDKAGVAYELQNGGTAIGVQSAQAAQARVAVAGAGLSDTGQQKGFELFDKQKMGTSDFQQKVNYQRALEGEIANTISQVQGVAGAKVQLVMPDDQLFAADRQPATAAVLLDGDAGALDAGQIRGMAQLVSSSVKGLALNKVTITDGTGTLLWPRDGADGTGTDTSKLAAEQRYDQTLEAKLQGLLAGTVGADKARVQVNATLNVDKSSEKRLIYGQGQAPNGAPALTKQGDSEKLRSTGGSTAAGKAGTAGNIPSYASATAGNGNSNYTHKTQNDTFGVNKTVRETQFAPGAVQKQTVGVILDASVPRAVANQVQTAVASAAGIDVGRGDQLTVSRVAFAKPPSSATSPNAIAGYLSYAKWALLGLAALLFLFFTTRGLRKREREALGEPVWLREITAPQPLAALEADTMMMSQAQVERSSVRRRAEELAAKEPAKVAQQLRAWMQEEA